MNKVLMTCSFCFALAIPTLAMACEEPSEKPDIPDPETSATAQMVMANNEVRDYVAAMEEYIGCSRMNSNQKRRAVTALEEFADEFNQAVRQFRALNE